nr:hypothetical protein [Anaerolineales bacterium]
MAARVVGGRGGLMMGLSPTWSKDSCGGQISNTTDGIYSDLKSFPACGSGRVNAYSALTVIPVPDLSLLTDSIEYGDATGDEDGIPDAGETVTVTMLVKDYWGEATNVIGTLSTSDPYVTLLDTDGIWGDISAYATMRNSGDPFAFSLDPAAPNNHQVNFTLDVTSNGGAYTAQASFSFLVQRGIEIPHALFPAVIDQDMTLHSDYLYIVKQNMLVQQGITLTIEPGTRLQFDPDKFIKIQGTLIASGTADLPIYFTSNQKDPQPGDFKGVIFDDLAVDATLAPMPTVTLPAAEGSAILGIGTVITLTNPPQFSAAGDVYFSAVISGTPNYEGIFRYVDGVGVEPEIVAGDAAPSGGQFIGFDEFYVSDYGDVHFIGQISGGSATNGMFKKTFDGLTTIVEAGDAVPAVSGGTFTGFKHLTVNDYGNDSWVAFAGTYDDGAGGTGIGLYVQRADLDRLLKVPFDDVTWATGTVQEIHAVWIGSPWQGGPDAMLSGSSGVALTYSGYNDTYQNYYSYVSWTEHWDMPTPLGGTFDTGTDDRRYYLNYTWYTAMGIKNGSVSRALFKCESPVGCTDTSQVVRKDGDPLPGGGILDLSGPFDLAWDGSHLVFGAVVSGTNTTRLVRILDGGSMENVFAEGFPLTDSTTISSIGSLPNGVFANPHGEYALLVDTTSGQRVMCTKPRNEYVGGSILDHVILEYGGGLALEGAYPYVANSIFRTSTGVAFTGQSCPAAIVAVNRIDGGQLIFTHSHVVDNTGRGMFVQGSQGRVVIAYSELSRNVESNWIPNCEYLSGGALLEGPITVVESDVSYNQVRYGGYSNAAGVRLIGYQGRLLSTRINRNQMSREAPMYPMPAGIKLEGGPHVIYGNTISSNRDWRGAPAQGENVEGGRALQVGGAASLMSFNTVGGN